MAFTINCPKCQTALKAAPEYVGKRANCRKCGEKFVIEQPVSSTSTEAIRLPVTPPLTGGLQETLKTWWPVALVVTGAAAMGFYAGREHYKYQLSRDVKSVVEKFQQTIAQEKPQAASASAPVAKVTRINIGDTYHGPSYSISLDSAMISKTLLRGLGRSQKMSDNELLNLFFSVANTDERKVLRISSDFIHRTAFRLEDDAGNQIRGVSFGFASRPEGSLQPADDINPGTSVAHVEAFSVPLPKTKQITLTLNLGYFNDSGMLEIVIPASEIEDFQKES